MNSEGGDGLIDFDHDYVVLILTAHSPFSIEFYAPFFGPFPLEEMCPSHRRLIFSKSVGLNIVGVCNMGLRAIAKTFDTLHEEG